MIRQLSSSVVKQSNNSFEEWSTKMEFNVNVNELCSSTYWNVLLSQQSATLEHFTRRLYRSSTQEKNVGTETAIKTIDGHGYEKDGHAKMEQKMGCSGSHNQLGTRLNWKYCRRKEISILLAMTKNRLPCYESMNLARDWNFENIRSSDTIICKDSLSLSIVIDSINWEQVDALASYGTLDE